MTFAKNAEKHQQEYTEMLTAFRLFSKETDPRCQCSCHLKPHPLLSFRQTMDGRIRYLQISTVIAHPQDISKKILVDNKTGFSQFTPPPHFWGQVTSVIEGRMKILHKEYLYQPTLGTFGQAPRFESRPGPHHPNASGRVGKRKGSCKKTWNVTSVVGCWDIVCVCVSSIQSHTFRICHVSMSWRFFLSHRNGSLAIGPTNAVWDDSGCTKDPFSHSQNLRSSRLHKTVAPSSRICCQEAEWHRSTLVHAWTSWRYKTLVHYTSQYLTWVLHSDIQLFSQIHGILPTPSGCQPQVLPFLVPKLQCPKGREKPWPQHPKPDRRSLFPNYPMTWGQIRRFC